MNPLARALDFKLDSSRSLRFCSNFAAPRSTHAWPLVNQQRRIQTDLHGLQTTSGFRKDRQSPETIAQGLVSELRSMRRRSRPGYSRDQFEVRLSADDLELIDHLEKR